MSERFSDTVIIPCTENGVDISGLTEHEVEVLSELVTIITAKNERLNE